MSNGIYGSFERWQWGKEGGGGEQMYSWGCSSGIYIDMWDLGKGWKMHG